MGIFGNVWYNRESSAFLCYTTQRRTFTNLLCSWSDSSFRLNSMALVIYNYIHVYIHIFIFSSRATCFIVTLTLLAVFSTSASENWCNVLWHRYNLKYDYGWLEFWKHVLCHRMLSFLSLCLHAIWIILLLLTHVLVQHNDSHSHNN